MHNGAEKRRRKRSDSEEKDLCSERRAGSSLPGKDFGNSVDRFMAQLGLVGVAKIPSSNVTNDVELNVRGRFEFLGDNVKEKKSLYNCFYLLLYLGINF